MKKYYALLLAGLAGCQQQTAQPTGAGLLLGDWYMQQVTFYSYTPNGALTSRQTSAAGTNNKIIITERTLSYYSAVSVGPGPGGPGQWIARSYQLRGDTIRYADNARPALITRLTPTALTLHYSDKPYATGAGYTEYDEEYTR